MPDLDFQVMSAEPITFSAAPTLGIRLKVTNANAEEPIQNVSLQCQIQIEASKRPYTDEEKRQLLDLFGHPHRWSQTLRTLLWTHANVNVPPFTESVEVCLPVPCTFDFNVAATKYFHALSVADVPLLIQFSGTIFFRVDHGLQATQISWQKEARYQMPVSVWKQMMDHYYPNCAWLCLRRDAFEALYEYKQERSIPTFEQALHQLLESARQGTVS